MSLLLALNSDDRPRERLCAHGPAALADAELLAVMLGTGRRGEDVIQLATRLLGRFGGLRGVSETSDHELRNEPGIGPARSAALQAAFEVGRRVVGSRPVRGHRLAHAADVWEHFRARLGTAPLEEFWILGLDVRHRVQLELCVARGCLTGVEVHPREVFRPLIRAACAAALLCHNHPSGDPTPSRQDRDLTARLREVGDLCGIAILDHVVVAADGYVSLATGGW